MFRGLDKVFHRSPSETQSRLEWAPRNEFSAANDFFGGSSRDNAEFFKYSCMEWVVCAGAAQDVMKFQAKHSVYLHHLSHARSAFAADERVGYLAKNACNLAVVNVGIGTIEIA